MSTSLNDRLTDILAEALQGESREDAELAGFMKCSLDAYNGPPRSAPSFRDELAAVVNRHSMENGSDTPDFILAGFLEGCLATFDATMAAREKWYGRGAGDGAALLGDAGGVLAAPAH